jgi:hypothetical protein
VPPLPALPILGDVLIELLEDTNGTGVGDIVIYTIPVTNEGESTLTDLSLTIEQGMISDSVDCPTELSGGEQVTCEASSALSQADVDAGEVTTKITVSGQDADTGATVSVSETTTYDLLPLPIPGLAIDADVELRELNDLLGVNAGDRLDYSFAVKNTGALTLSDVVVEDSKLEIVTCPPEALSPGETTECTADYQVQPMDEIAGNVHVEATVHAVTGLGAPAEATAEVLTTPIIATPLLGGDAAVSFLIDVAPPGPGPRTGSIVVTTEEPALDLVLDIQAVAVAEPAYNPGRDWVCTEGDDGQSAQCTIKDSANPSSIPFRGDFFLGSSVTAIVRTPGNTDPDPTNNIAVFSVP